MHLQQYPVLSDINAKNFDDAFTMFYPVIFGLADSSTNLTDAKAQDMVDRLQTYFDPYVNEEHFQIVRARYADTILDPVVGHPP
ncbi:hypothetical protein B0H19DRAFT_1257028 [Mycena capillaripes]|nr:hypothetical protein B0H19DRAFT_1257028 [Mycena capillaripes]